MLKRCIALFTLLSLLSTATAVADVVIATETGRGEYENGRFTPGKPEFRYRFELDEAAGRAKLTEITRLNTGALIQLSVDYVIIAAQNASATSSILVNKDRRGQKILTLVGKPGNLAIETILRGEKFSNIRRHLLDVSTWLPVTSSQQCLSRMIPRSSSEGEAA